MANLGSRAETSKLFYVAEGLMEDNPGISRSTAFKKARLIMDGGRYKDKADTFIAQKERQKSRRRRKPVERIEVTPATDEDYAEGREVLAAILHSAGYRRFFDKFAQYPVSKLGKKWLGVLDRLLTDAQVGNVQLSDEVTLLQFERDHWFAKDPRGSYVNFPGGARGPAPLFEVRIDGELTVIKVLRYMVAPTELRLKIKGEDKVMIPHNGTEHHNSLEENFRPARRGVNKRNEFILTPELATAFPGLSSK